MSNCKLVVLLTVLLTAHLISEIQANSICERPKTFESPESVKEYVSCMKSYASTRYGKRAPPTLLGRLRPYAYDYDLQQIQDLLYPEN